MGKDSKDIKKRIKTIQNIQKVTRSMKLMSTAKLKQFIKAIENNLLYKRQLINLIYKVYKNLKDFENEKKLFTNHRKINTICLLAISGDKGLCGAYNIQIAKFLEKRIKELKKQGYEIKLVLIGKKISAFTKRFLLNNVKEIIFEIENSKVEENWNTLNDLKTKFINNEFERLELIYTRFTSSINSEIINSQLFPLNLELENLTNEEANINYDDELLIFEPNINLIFSNLVTAYIKNKLLNALQNARTSETATRVNSMTAATENAEKLINELILKYNKARQSAITQEISEIITSVESIKR